MRAGGRRGKGREPEGGTLEGRSLAVRSEDGEEKAEWYEWTLSRAMRQTRGTEGIVERTRLNPRKTSASTLATARRQLNGTAWHRQRQGH